jgi:hypothetical protein
MDNVSRKRDTRVRHDFMLVELSLTSWQNKNLLVALGEVFLGGCAVPTSDRNGERGRKIDQEVMFLKLINSLGDRSDLKLAEILRGDKLLVVQGPEAGVVVSSVKYSESFAHEHLVGSETSHQVGRGELDGVTAVTGRNCEDIIFNVRN